MNKTIRLALFGHGTVGWAVRRIIIDNQSQLSQAVLARTGRSCQFEIIGLAVAQPDKHPELADQICPADELVEKDYDILIELIGGQQPASGYITAALKRGKDVITANKMALFLAQGELEQTARQHGAYLRYEAAVAGAIPILRSLPGLASGKTLRIEGILNGSTNYILTRVAQGLSLDQAIVEASDLGYLEADPTSDLAGYDALYKLGILVYLMNGRYPKEEDIERRGITQLRPEDILSAGQAGQKYKLIASAEPETGRYAVRPVALTPEHLLYHVDGALNGISLQHEWAGQLSFIGPGAGGPETASAVIGDLLDIVCVRFKEGYYD